MTSNLFVPHIIHPTRITSTTKTLIDNIFSNASNFSDAQSGNITISLSDHLAQFLIIPNDNNIINKAKCKQDIMDTKNLDLENYILDMFDMDWDISKFDDPNMAFDYLDSHINNTNKKHITMRKMTKKEVLDMEKPWINSETKKLINEKNKLYSSFIKEKDTTKKANIKSKYKTLKNTITAKIRTDKKMYYDDYFGKNSDNLRNTWRGIKSIISISDSKSNPNSLLVNKKLISDPKEVANEFNKYFSNIAGNLQSRIHVNGLNFRNYLDSPNESSIFIAPTSKTEILTTIAMHIKNKGTGPHSIPYKILHLIREVIAAPLADILNLSFETGIYIDKLKTSRVVPVFKEKGSNLSSENYRPISLLSNINKIFEKIMHERIYEYLEKQNMIYLNQFGFRLKHSTIHALINMTEMIRRSIDKNQFVAGVFIDLQKAFDTVDHDILLAKLDYYGIRGVTNNWFRSYLSNRKQFVSVNNVESDTATMHYGVPQGSVLGPLLFLIYINDLHKAIKYSTTCHFADDTAILYPNQSLKQLQKHVNIDLKLLCKWLKANKISLNASKTELMIFRNPHKIINFNLKIKIDGKIIFPSQKIKYLGIILDPHLNGSAHVSYIAPKLNRAIGMLAKLRHFVSHDTILSVYYAIFASIMNYGCIIWGQIPNQHITRIQNIQNKVIKILSFAKYSDDEKNLYPQNGIIKFTDQIKLENFLYVHSSLQGNVPIPLKNQFLVTADHREPHTRGASLTKLILPKVYSQNYGIYSITYKATAYWNLVMGKIPANNFIKVTKGTVKDKLMQYFIDFYKNT